MPVIARRPARALAALALALLLPACTLDNQADPIALAGLGDSIFLVQTRPATAVMEALFDGRVATDGAGCMRLEPTGSEGATVVWPYGFTLRELGGELYVMDAWNRSIGRLGGEFRFGGGFVPTLHRGIPLDGSARATAEERCPGSYWIVGEVP